MTDTSKKSDVNQAYETTFTSVPDVVECQYSTGMFLTSKFASFLKGIASSGQMSLELSLSLLSTMEVIPRNSLEKKPYFFVIADGWEIHYDSTGKILRIDSTTGNVAGNDLYLIAGAQSRHGRLVYASKDSVCLSSFYQTRVEKGKNYLQLPTGCARVVNTNKKFETTIKLFLMLLQTYLGDTVPSLVVLNVVKELSEDLVSALNDVDSKGGDVDAILLLLETTMINYIDNTNTSGEDEIEGAKGYVAKFLNGIEGLVVAKMDMSSLQEYLKSIKKVRRLAQLLPLLSIKLPRVVQTKSLLAGKDKENEILTSTIDNVAPGCFILTERQKSTPAAVRAFLAKKNLDVYYSMVERPILKNNPSSDNNGKRKRGLQSTKASKPTAHDTVQATLFHSIRDGIVIGAVELRNEPMDLPPATTTKFTF